MACSGKSCRIRRSTINNRTVCSRASATDFEQSPMWGVLRKGNTPIRLLLRPGDPAAVRPAQRIGARGAKNFPSRRERYSSLDTVGCSGETTGRLKLDGLIVVGTTG